MDTEDGPVEVMKEAEHLASGLERQQEANIRRNIHKQNLNQNGFDHPLSKEESAQAQLFIKSNKDQSHSRIISLPSQNFIINKTS